LPSVTIADDEQDVALKPADSEPQSESGLQVPDELPILPLRGLVVYPQTAMPLNIGQPRSVRLVDEVVTGDRLIGLAASKNPDLETPGPDDIYSIGTMAAVLRLFRAPDGTIRLLVQGIARIHVDAYTTSEPYLKAKVTHVPETIETGIEVEALMRNVIDQFTKLADLVPSIPGELITSALNVEDPLQLVYAIATYIRLSLENYQRILELNSVTDKLRLLMNILNKEIEVLELGRKIQTEAQSEIERVQREYFLREQLKAIRRELGEEDDQLRSSGRKSKPRRCPTRLRRKHSANLSG
jgi:ATP-dependent Lon protease